MDSERSWIVRISHLVLISVILNLWNRFNATKLLEKLRNKRMVFVGDSINRNQWVSLVCMVEASIPEGQKMRVYNGSLISFKAFVCFSISEYFKGYIALSVSWSRHTVSGIQCDDRLLLVAVDTRIKQWQPDNSPCRVPDHTGRKDWEACPCLGQCWRYCFQLLPLVEEAEARYEDEGHVSSTSFWKPCQEKEKLVKFWMLWTGIWI